MAGAIWLKQEFLMEHSRQYNKAEKIEILNELKKIA